MKELEELGRRIRQQRIAAKVKQKDLAEKAAVSLDVLYSLEHGKPVTTESLARVLRALKHPNALADLLPPPAISPIDLQKLQGRQRQRVR